MGLNFGVVGFCPECKRGNVIIRSFAATGPTEVMKWSEEERRYKYSHTEDDQETHYGLECGHTVTKTALEEATVPKFVRWYPVSEDLE